MWSPETSEPLFEARSFTRGSAQELRALHGMVEPYAKHKYMAVWAGGLRLRASPCLPRHGLSLAEVYLNRRRHQRPFLVHPPRQGLSLLHALKFGRGKETMRGFSPHATSIGHRERGSQGGRVGPPGPRGQQQKKKKTKAYSRALCKCVVRVWVVVVGSMEGGTMGSSHGQTATSPLHYVLKQTSDEGNPRPNHNMVWSAFKGIRVATRTPCQTR